MWKLTDSFPIISVPFEKTGVSPIESLTPLSNIRWPNVRVFFPASQFYPICLRLSLYPYCGFVVSFKIDKCESSMFFFRIGFTILGPLNFHMNFKISLLISEKKSGEILMGIFLDLYISLGSAAILEILSLTMHEHRCVFIYSLIQKHFVVFNI